ncbi:hypothetical protein BV22DRAFT_1028131 [Leucogyrophana mollusca]|uniref:Uncharacterized protein n=1 Tax=Leucogyrophana mollusca TaxID=85980 RepID=A0ACB8BYU1_9AGAM|nr:hypothetical protein BV22DRAFT_1028131 [Leucogyrophana mollusca]
MNQLLTRQAFYRARFHTVSLLTLILPAELCFFARYNEITTWAPPLVYIIPSAQPYQFTKWVIPMAYFISPFNSVSIRSFYAGCTHLRDLELSAALQSNIHVNYQ